MATPTYLRAALCFEAPLPPALKSSSSDRLSSNDKLSAVSFLREGKRKRKGEKEGRRDGERLGCEGAEKRRENGKTKLHREARGEIINTLSAHPHFSLCIKL